MYLRLRAEMALAGVDKKQLAEMTGIKYPTLCAKLSGAQPFKFEETVLIRRAIGSEYPVEELFREGNE